MLFLTGRNIVPIFGDSAAARKTAMPFPCQSRNVFSKATPQENLPIFAAYFCR
jgi:hypothetical protein